LTSSSRSWAFRLMTPCAKSPPHNQQHALAIARVRWQSGSGPAAPALTMPTLPSALNRRLTMPARQNACLRLLPPSQNPNPANTVAALRCQRGNLATMYDASAAIWQKPYDVTSAIFTMLIWPVTNRRELYVNHGIT
jgi:hypothetical protein